MSLFDVLQATWPPASAQTVGPWQICEGQGGGQRVSAARALEEVTDADIPQAEAAMRALGQHPLFLIRPGEDALDQALEARGYRVSDPTLFMECPTEAMLSGDVPPVTCFPIWPPLQIMWDIWRETGMNPARFEIMKRVAGAKTAIFGRINARPAGVVFVAISEGTAMVHALEIDPNQRRNGLGRFLMRGAADWAKSQGADTLVLAVVAENAPARALYQALGMTETGGYHYRKAP